MSSLFADRLEEHLETMRSIESQAEVFGQIAEKMIAAMRAGGKICFMGNGGSAADSQHLAAELVGRFQKERRGLASIAFTTDTSILTAVANDYGYDAIFSRQVEGLCGPSDIVVGLSTSGNSPNVLAGIERAKEMGVFTVGLAGKDGGKLAAAADLAIVVPSPKAARIQEAHIFIGHTLCEAIEDSI
ncbi:MAG: D-sedoheptulose 7-phosphate isomerase [Verrucomicrobiales bacterium]|jgi:D-sedoheptulose 7-phosphate isomerase